MATPKLACPLGVSEHESKFLGTLDGSYRVSRPARAALGLRRPYRTGASGRLWSLFTNGVTRDIAIREAFLSCFGYIGICYDISHINIGYSFSWNVKKIATRDESPICFAASRKRVRQPSGNSKARPYGAKPGHE